MIWEELTVYTARKELSAKAVKEVVDILAKGEYSEDDDISKLNTVLLKFNPDVLYDFFASDFAVVTDDLIEKIVNSIDVHNPVKAGHVYVAVIALAKAKRQSQASTLLKRFVQANLPKKAGNKSLYEGFRRAIKYGNDSYLFAKLEGWGNREINLYEKLLLDCAEYLNDSKFTEAAEIFCRNNGKPIVRGAGETVIKNISDNEGSVHETPKSSFKTTDSLDLGEIVKLLLSKVKAIQIENNSKSEEIENLKSENLELKKLNLSLSAEAEKLNAQKNNMTEKASDLESKVRMLTKELEELRNALEINKAKLSNVESAFGQAGQTEIDALKGNICKRLSSEYEKYVAIKDKTPDLGYYEILLAILEDVFRALKKNGITF